MAPASRGRTSYRPNGKANGGEGFEPPPSTMAAQLINNLSAAEKPSRQRDQDELKALMAEVSSAENSGVELEPLKAKLEHKHKLIYVFSRTVLERLTGDDPFIDFQQVAAQAYEAMEVFITIIKEIPDVLAYIVPPHSTYQCRGPEPLWIWLFPRILALLGRRHCEKLTEKIKDFFYISFQAVAQSPKLWVLASFFFRYLKECAATLLNHCHRPNSICRMHAMIPYDHMDISMFSNNKEEENQTTIFDCAYLIDDPAVGLWHVTNILSMLVDISMESAMSHDATPAFQDYLAWILDSILISHDLPKRWRMNPRLHELCRKSAVMSFCTVHALLTSHLDFLTEPMLRKGYVLLSILSADLVEHHGDLREKPVLINLCSSILHLVAICKKSHLMRRAVSLHLVPTLEAFLLDLEAHTNLGKDFQKAATSLCQTCVIAPLQELDEVSDENFDSIELEEEFYLLGLDTTRGLESGPPSKRRKVYSELELLDQITSMLYSLLGSQNVTDLAGLGQLTERCYSELTDKERCRAIEYLGMIPCAADGSLIVTREQDGNIRYSVCTRCEGSLDTVFDKSGCQRVSQDCITILSKITKAQAFQSARRPRILAMVALRRFSVHFREPEFLDLENSSLAQWCLQSLNSSLRELRVSAGRTLPGFFHGAGMRQELIRKNRRNALEIMRSILAQNTLHLQETCILALGQVGRTLKDDELNIVLVTLVESLGHSNPIISGVAFNEILSLANAAELTVEQMFKPFWDTIAIIAVNDLLVKPQTSQLMADLLGKSVQGFLVMTQSFTLPYLVMSGKIDVISRISQASSRDENYVICMDPKNLIPILALLVVQNVADLERYISSLLIATSPVFKEFDVTYLMRVEPSSLALHLLKAAGLADDYKKGRIRLALTLLAQWAPPSEGHHRKSNPLGAFLERHILGLVSRLSEVVNDAQGQKSISEKKNCVKGIEELVKIGKTFTRSARPQMCACLQSALAQKELQSLAFSAWETMLINLEDEDVELMLESTFSTVIQRWTTFDESTQRKVESALLYLLKDRTRLLRNTIVNIPSLSQIPVLSVIEEQLNTLRTPTDISNAFQIFSRRISHENSAVVTQSLVELKAYLKLHQSFLQSSAVSEQPDIVVGSIVRSILDCCVKFNQAHHDIARLSAECIGLIGCLDPNRVESVREQREIVVVSNFHDPGETTDFVLFILEEVIVKAFLSTTDTGVQGFLSYVMQILLERCDFQEICVPIIMNGLKGPPSEIWQKWLALPLTVQDTLTPFLTSKYSLTDLTDKVKVEYPIFRPETVRPEKMYVNWLKAFVMDLLYKPLNANADLIFTPLRRAIRIRENSVAEFLLPYVVLHVIVEGTDQNRVEIGEELLGILQYQITPDSSVKREQLKMCSEAVFRVLDYLSRWIQQKQLRVSENRNAPPIETFISGVTSVLRMIPADVISQRAVECKSYSRALFYWEQHIREVRDGTEDVGGKNGLLERLQDIYTQIDEPDGIEGISAHLHVLDIDQQILGHRKAGRWTAAQSWYEIKLAENPDNVDVQVNLLTCLKESGQHGQLFSAFQNATNQEADVLLNYVEGMHTATKTVSRLLPFATEASWATGRWPTLEKYTKLAPKDGGEDFNVKVGEALLALHGKNIALFTSTVQSLREQIACTMSLSTTPSLGACHDIMLKFHVLTELEMIAGTDDSGVERAHILDSLNKRIEVIGAYLNDKQYLLGIRRAAMQLSKFVLLSSCQILTDIASLGFTKDDIAAAWLTSARLARKGDAIHQSFNAVLHASQLGDQSATIEHARLLWKEGHHRKAIQSLQGAIDSNAFISHDRNAQELTAHTNQSAQQNLLTARAHLLLAKWLDSAGQTHSTALRSQYQLAARTHTSWEKGHYYLGRHYNKLLETEKALAPEHQAESYLTGETAKLVIENYLRSLSYGTKYIYQTLPRILTLWLDLGSQVGQSLDAKYGNSKDFITRVTNGRKDQLAQLHARFNKYIHKVPAYMFYTALPQIIARIAHPNAEVYKYLQSIILRVVSAHPQQSLWSLLAVCTSVQADRKTRGLQVLQALRNTKKADSGALDIKVMIRNGEKLTNELLLVCNAGEFPGNRVLKVSITKDLKFNHKTCTPNPLAVPIESVLTATLPTLTDSVRGHKAFSRDVVTISSFLDEVTILGSLQKPRKITALGSDGRKYGLLCKPKDDLRKDQRLMEFNSMINRSLKRDAESSRRQLYIKTYAVTPLNEECGIIEWVNGLKTLRDILLQIYRAMGISPNYREIEMFCDEALKAESKMPFYTEKVLKQFPPVFHKWFVQQFPEPSAWFAARLRYTRSCAVMSMVGTILGLGDRHGENILFEEGNGGTFHVDFNCLFDKGLTFVRPERVPFRLTHNMIDAMGIYGYEGPFRKSSELTLKLLRQHEETLMTILEAFVYDPTLDLLAKKPEKKKKEGSITVPHTAQGVLNSIQRKVKGLLPGESVPLGVEGQVDELIMQATNLQFLAGMYIGWCSFF